MSMGNTSQLQPSLIIFDLNHTLIQENTWERLNMAMGVTAEEDSLLMKWGREGVIDDSMGQKILCSIYRSRGDVSRENILKIISDYQYSPGARKTIQTLRERGYELALVSGSMDILTETVGKELGIQHKLSNNSFVFNDNDELERIETLMNDVEYKVFALDQLCERLSIRRENCVCVGDGANDELIFGAAGQSVLVSESNEANVSTDYRVANLLELLEILP